MKMIVVKAPFKHAGLVFYEGERRFVDDADAAYFAKHGWANVEGEPVVEAVPADVKLDVHSNRHVNKGSKL